MQGADQTEGGAFNLRLSYRAQIDSILVIARGITRLGIQDTITDITGADSHITLNDVNSLNDSPDINY